MCGRVNVSDNEGVRQLLESMGMNTWPSRDPRYNIAPTQTLDVVLLQDESLTLVPMSWGVSLTVPGKTKMITKRVQNSRSDKVWTSRMWRSLIARQRVLVPVNGFYEWRRKNRKLEAAFYITPSQGPAMFFAGIYRKRAEENEKPEMSIMTTEANGAMSAVHDRMPVILTSQNAAMAWLQDDNKSTLDQLMQPTDDAALTLIQVSEYVNKSANEGPDCIAPLAA